MIPHNLFEKIHLIPPLKSAVTFIDFNRDIAFEIFFAEPERRVDERYHYRHFDERPYDGGEGRAVFNAEHADCDCYCKFEIIAGGRERKRGRLFVSGVEFHAQIEAHEEHHDEID